MRAGQPRAATKPPVGAARRDQFVLIDAYPEPDARRAPIEADRRRAFRQGIPALRHVGAFRSGGTNLRLPSGEVAFISAAYITPDSFAVLPYTPVADRAMNQEDARRKSCRPSGFEQRKARGRQTDACSEGENDRKREPGCWTFDHRALIAGPLTTGPLIAGPLITDY